MDEEPASAFGAKTMTQSVMKLVKPLAAGKYKKLLFSGPFSSTKTKSNVCSISKHIDLHGDFLTVQDRGAFQTAGLGHSETVATLLGGGFGTSLRGKKLFPLVPRMVQRSMGRCSAKAYSSLCHNNPPCLSQALPAVLLRLLPHVKDD